jgi:hypothetical protein
MDLVMEEKPTSSDCPLVLTTSTAISSSTTSSTTPQMSQQMVTSSVPSIQPSFTSGVPTLLTPSQMSSLTTSSAQQSANATSKYAQLLQVIEELGFHSLLSIVLLKVWFN